MADGSVACVHGSDTHISYIHSDPAGETFSTVIIDTTIPPYGLSACQLASGNIGIAYFTNDGYNYRLKYRIITEAGEAVASGEIASWAVSTLTGHTWTIALPGGDYLMIYAKGDDDLQANLQRLRHLVGRVVPRPDRTG